MGTEGAIKTMIQKNNLMTNMIIFLADKEVSWMSIAMYESEFEHHSCKDIDEVVSNFFGIYSFLDHLLLLIDLNAFHKLHHYQSV